MSKVIACIDFSNQGHRLHLMRSVIQTIIQAGHTAVCITDDTQEIKTRIDECCPKDSGRVIYYNHTCTEPTGFKLNKELNDILIAMHYWRQYNSVLKTIEKAHRITIDAAIINYIDLFLSCLMPHTLQNLFFDYRWAGIYVHTRYMRMFEHLGVQTKKSKISDIDYPFKSDKCIGIGVFDNGINRALEFRLDKKVTLIPDISDVSTDKQSYPMVEEVKRRANGRMIVGSIGMSYYSGTVDLIKLAIACREEDYFFVFTGTFEEVSYLYIPEEADKELLRNFRKNPPENCFWKEGYLKDEFEYNAVFNTLDVVFMMYPQHYTSSNRLTKAAYFHKLVLASNRHCVGENVQKYHLGEVAEPGNTRQQAEKLAVIRKRIKEKETPAAEWKEYFSLNNEAMFQLQIKEMMGPEF